MSSNDAAMTTYKQTEGRCSSIHWRSRQDLLLLLLLRLVAEAEKGLYYDCVYSYKDRVPNIYSLEI